VIGVALRFASATVLVQIADLMRQGVRRENDNPKEQRNPSRLTEPVSTDRDDAQTLSRGAHFYKKFIAKAKHC
jgi:hypothetical protein